MTPFFLLRLRRILKKTPVPHRADMVGRLHAELFGQQAIPEPRTSWLRRFSIIVFVPVAVVAFAVYGVPLIQKSPSPLSVSAVLAESLHNTFELDTVTDFIHQRIAITFGNDQGSATVDSWRYQDNVRTRFAVDASQHVWEYLQSSEASCTYTDRMYEASLSSDQEYLDPKLECATDVDPDLPALVPGSLMVEDMRIAPPQSADAENVVGYLEWTLATEEYPEALFSYEHTGYHDGQWGVLGGELPNTYRVQLSIPQFSKNDTISQKQFVQIRTAGVSSAVYEIDLEQRSVREVSPEELVHAQQAYLQQLRAQIAEAHAPQEMYDDFFGVAIAIQDDVDELILMSQRDELYLGEPVTRARYTLSSNLEAQEEFSDIHMIEFVMSVSEKQIVAFTTYDREGVIIQQVTVEVREIVQDDPVDFFSVEQWKQEIGVK